MRIEGIVPEHILKRLPADVRAKMGKAGRTMKECLEVAEARSEKELQEQIKSYLDRKSIYYVWSRMDRKTTTRTGTPDFLICKEGRFIGIECKTATGKQSDDQIKAQFQIEMSGGAYHLVRSYREFLTIIGGF